MGLPIHVDGFGNNAVAIPLGKLWLAHAELPQCALTRPPVRIGRTHEHRYYLFLQQDGQLAVLQDGRLSNLAPGDLVLCDSTAPYRLVATSPCSTLVLIVGAADLKRRLPAPADMVGVKLSGREGLTATTSLMMKSIWEQGRAGLLPGSAGASIAESLLDVLVTACIAAGVGRNSDSGVSVGRRLQIRRHIEANLRDPEMSARSIAASFGISTRYLHILFAAEDETVSNYMLRRRLEETARQLSDAAWRRRTITEVAFGWGFNNATHFARVFKDRFGLSPRDFRASACASACGGAGARISAAA
jgi:AraC-like DNA-binding protein